MSFRLKLVLSFLVVNIVSLAVFYFWTTRQLNDFLQQQAINSLVEELSLLAEICRVSDPELDPLVDRLAVGLDSRITVTNLDGRVVADSAFSGPDLGTLESHSNRPEIRDALRFGLGQSLRFSTSISQDLLYVARPTADGLGIVRIARRPDDIESLSSGLRNALTSGAMIIVLLGGLAVWIISLRMTGSIRTLSTAAARISSGDFVSDIQVDSRDEVGRLARQMEEMSSRLEDQVTLLRAERDYVTTVFRSMSEGVLVTDQKGRITASNPSFVNMFSVRGEPEGKFPVEVARIPEISDGIGRVLENRRYQETELKVPGKTILARFAPIGTMESLAGVVVVFLDISELRRLERLHKDFVSNVSHELKTPLTSIQGYAETLLDEPDLEGVHRRFIEKVYKNATQLSEMIGELFQLARLEAGEALLEYRPVSFEALMQFLRDEFADQLSRKGLTFVWSNAGQRDSFPAGERYIGRVFRNLIENAIKYTNEGRIEARMVEREDLFGFSVSDTGKGIPEENLGRIFERFYRVDQDRSRDSGGSGIGLAIVKHIVQLHRGRVWAESRLGEGTTIFFTLPKRESRSSREGE